MRAQKGRATGDEVYGPLFEACKRLPCILGGHPDHQCWGPVTGHHVKRVGAGGVDWENVVPMCRHLHALCHGQSWGTTERDVERRFQIDLGHVATWITHQIRGTPEDCEVEVDLPHFRMGLDGRGYDLAY